MIVKLNCNVFIETDADDPQDIANQFERGAVGAMDHFPAGDVFQIDIETAEKLSAEEIKERGFEE